MGSQNQHGEDTPSSVLNDDGAGGVHEVFKRYQSDDLLGKTGLNTVFH